MIAAQRVDFVAIPTRDRERAARFWGVCHGAAFTDPDGNGLLIHHRYAPYRHGTTP